MVDIHTILSRLICVEPPTFLLPFLDYFSNISMMTNLNTFIFFQLNYHPFPVSIILISYFRFGYYFSARVRMFHVGKCRIVKDVGNPDYVPLFVDDEFDASGEANYIDVVGGRSG